MGDLNAEVGQEEDGLIIGKRGLESKMNEGKDGLHSATPMDKQLLTHASSSTQGGCGHGNAPWCDRQH